MREEGGTAAGTNTQGGSGERGRGARGALEALGVARALGLAEVDAARRRALRAVTPGRAALAVDGAADARGRRLEVLAAATEEVLAGEGHARRVHDEGGDTPLVVGVRHL